MTIDFRGYAGLADSYDFFNDGIGVTVTAGIFNSSGNVSTGGYVGQYSRGLGATTHYYDSHQVDGYHNNDILLFNFDQTVRLHHIVFSYVDWNDRFRFFHDSDGNGLLNDFGWNTDIPNSGVYVFNSLWEGTLFGIGAKGKYDNFKIKKIYVTAVPLPAALPLFAGGLGVFGFLGWRKNRRLATE